MKDTMPGEHPAGYDPFADIYDVPEEPFGIAAAYWKACLILFSFVLMATTVVLLMGGITPHVIGALYVIPAILFAYFYRRRGVLVVYLISMFFFAVVVLFRYPGHDDIFAAGLQAILLIAIALTVSYLTHFLLLEKRKYHAIFDNTENGVAVVDLTTRHITEMNQRFRHAICMPASVPEPQSLEMFIKDPSRIILSLQSSCTSQSIETTLHRCDGTEWAAVVVGRKISGNHAVLTFVDITEKKRLDLELHRLHEDANLYLDILTHDINNINTASLNYGRLLEARSADPATDLTRNLVRSLEKSDDIIKNISTLRKIQDGGVNRIPLQISAIIKGEIAQFSGIPIDYDGSTATVLADEMLSSVFYNLIGNAIKYGGKDPEIVIRVEEKETKAVVTIADSGPGIPDYLKQGVFDRFQRGDTTVSGKGLGLYICKTLIERYGGSIRVEDRVPGEPGRGVVFRFTLLRP
ncbi:MAG TPA: HAMP domain-containing histidine kinase [Methanoregula sp.]|nr:HAMP domain-containing histidine kinase [Methanoregula sp.]